MNDLKRLFAANEFEQGNQRCVGWNGLPFAHDALRVDNFTRQHGATVHGELQNVNHFFAAIHFHVRACGHKESASLRLLRRSVIEQAPERSNGASSFNRAVIDINNAGIGGGNFLPFSLGGKRCQQHKQTGCNSHSEFRSGRQTYIWIGIVCGLGMLALSFLMRQRPPMLVLSAPGSVQSMASERPFGLSIKTAHTLLCVAGVACCVAMAMPQVHIVAYCSDLGFGAARGSEMLSLMLACGIVSRLISGAICDRIGGLKTLVLGSVLQGLALLLFLPFDGMVSLYVISALFGLFQGGIVPSYAIIVREYFPAQRAGVLVGAAIMATMIGMALGGWMSGKVFDLTGSYHAAFVNGVLWNALNLSIALFLLWRVKRMEHT